MIGKKYIKGLDFNSIEDIFEYILESKINGNYKQTKELINKLSKKQFNSFCDYFQCANYQGLTLNEFVKLREA